MNKIFLAHPYKVEGVYEYGQRFSVENGVVVERYATMPGKQFISMGAYSYSRSNGLPQATKIGRFCSLAEGLRVMGLNHPTDWITSNVCAFRPYAREFAMAEFGKRVVLPPFPAQPRPVEIGNDVWIGQGVLLRDGIRIGSGAIVAAGSVVTKSVPDFAIVGGAPAKIIRMRFNAELCERIKASRWWEYNFADFGDLPMNSVSDFLDGLEDRIAQNSIVKFEPGWIDIASDLSNYLREFA
ncbi:CatB-related O-acetyltransferase [Sphingobium sp. AntQ-1]|uniref:CatB-related O-acetyltransferase n=1 Tax=Sphingobium sp. AntQ-1 TaxID=2930091 RepID=UPI00234F530E|nr:CatB-related O-acetyltransferase [Sphingobium sp. AntQ-1]